MSLSTEKKVGFFFIAGLVLLGVMLEMGEKWNPFTKNVPYKTYLSSTTGLKVGDSVRLAGVEVGTIKKIGLEQDKVRIDFEVKPGTVIRTDSVATLRLTNLLGGQFLGLSFGSLNAPLLPGGSAVKSRDVANIDIIVDNVSDLTKDAKTLIIDLNRNQNEIMAKLSTIIDENRGSIRGSLANLDSITAKIDRGDGSLALLLNDRTLYANASELTTNLKNISGRMERGEGSLGKLMKDDALYDNAKGAIAGLNDGVKDLKEITAKVNRGEGSLGKLVNDDALYVEVRDASRNIKEITAKINKGEGTIGRLVNDDNLYLEATAAFKKTEKAMDGLADSGPISVLGSIIGTLF
jgi:phospholipid/cholesterol/gamma-HCH transport system substrate-binding protein